MSFLFKIEHKKVFPNPETLLITPFSEIWKRDKSKEKEIALKEFAFIEFNTSMLRSNPYREYPDDRKQDIIIEDVFGHKTKWKPDKLVEHGIRKIEEWQEEASVTYRYWLANKVAAEKMIDFFNNFDISTVNPKTLNPIYKPKDITSAIGDAQRTLTTLDTLKSKVEEEIYENAKTKGGKEISPFAKTSSVK